MTARARELALGAVLGLNLVLLGVGRASAGEADFKHLEPTTQRLERMSARVIEVDVLPSTREVILLAEESITTNDQAVQSHVRRRTWSGDDKATLFPSDPVPEGWLGEVSKLLDEECGVSLQYWDGRRHTSFSPGAEDPPVWKGVRLARPMDVFYSRDFLESSYYLMRVPIPRAVAARDSASAETAWGQKAVVLTSRKPGTERSSIVLLLDTVYEKLPCETFLFSNLSGAEALEAVQTAESPEALRAGFDPVTSYRVEAWMEVDGLVLPRRVRQRTPRHQLERQGPTVVLDRVWFVCDVAFHEGAAWGPLTPPDRGLGG